MTSDAFPAEIYQLLEKNRETLKSIRLDLRYVRNILAYQFDEALFRRGMAKFDSYPVLEELFLNSLLVFSPNKQCKMPPSALTNILPRSIVTLHIADCEFHGTFESTGEGLVHLAEAKISALFPNLKQVLCECDAKGRLDEYGLEEKFAKAGVEFAYETWSQAASQRPSGRNRDTRVIDP
jgi:hypothetical protein